MLAEISTTSPFDAIRHFDESGNEYWTGRELMPLLGYSKWQRFEDAIARAKVSLQNTNGLVEEHFSHLPGAVSWQGRFGDNYRLSRHACYLVAMNGDPRKSEIAAAQAYFVAKTRQAEVVIPQQSEELERLKLTNENLKLQIRREELQIRRDELQSSMLTLHGTAVVLALKGHSDQIIREEVLVTEVVKEKTGETQRILTADQLKKEVKRRTGQNMPSLKWFIDKLRANNRDDLVVPVTRHTTNEYVTPECLDEAIAIVFGQNRQKLLGE